MVSKNTKLPNALKNLEEALKEYAENPTELRFLTVSKTFEVLVEYVWRHLKSEVEEQGLEAPSPKIAIKQAAKIGLIQNPEMWLDCLEARNNSVHDYFGISEPEYIVLAKDLLKLAKKL